MKDSGHKASDYRKTKARLIEELEELRARLREAERAGKAAPGRAEAYFTEAIIRRSQEGVCVCHNVPDYPHVRFTLWNDRMTEITGYTMEEINRRGWYQTMYPDPETQARAAGRMAAMREDDDILSEEWTVVRAGGEPRVLSISTMVLFTRGDETHVGAFMRDVTELRRAEAEARSSQESLMRVVETIPGGIILVNPEGAITFANPAAREVLGLSGDELARRSYFSPDWGYGDNEGGPLRPEDLPVARVMASGKPEHRLEHTIASPEGERTHLSVNAAPLKDQDGHILSVIVSFTDVSTEKQAQRELSRSEARLRQVIDLVPHFIFAKDRQGKFILVNQSVADAYGTTVADLTGKTDADFNPNKEEVKHFLSDDLQVINSGQAKDIPQEIITDARGKVRILHTVKIPFSQSHGENDAVLGVSTDITEQVRFEQALEYRTRFERLVTVISARFIAVGPDDLFEEMAQALEEIGEFTGVDRSYVLVFSEDGGEFSAVAEWARGELPRYAGLVQRMPAGRFRWWVEQKKKGKPYIFDSLEQVPAAEAEARQLFAQLGVQSILEVPLMSAGRLIGVLGQAAVAAPRKWSEDHVSLLQLVAEIFANALTRHVMEKALRESEQKHRLVFTSASEGILVADSETMKFLYANPAVCRMLGYSEDELRELSVNDIHPPEDLDQVREMFRELAGGVKDMALDVPCRRKDGSAFFAEIRTGLINLEGRPCAVGFFNDVTLRRRAEEEGLRLAMVVQNSLELVNLADLDGRMVFLNEAGRRMLGVDPQEVESHSIIDVIPDHLRELVLSELMPALRAAGTWEGDLQYVNLKTGATTDALATCFTIPSMETGEPLLLANVSMDITARKKMEAALRESEEKYRTLFQCAPEGIVIVGLDGTVLDTNEYFGAPREAVVGRKFSELPLLHPEDRESLEQLFRQMLAGEPVERFTVRLLLGPGQVRWLECYSAFLEKNGAPYAVQVISRDVTDRKKLEDQLAQAQKMEAVGRLAGGVAHDFNNQLMVILNLAEFVHQTISPDDPRARQLELVIKAAEQSSALTRQLLAFSRKQVIEPLVINVNEALTRLERMLSRIIGEDINLKMALDAESGLARIDPTQLEQVIINLAVNARDAMPRGGKLTIETATVRLDHDYARTHPDLEPGDFLMVAVSDNGHGISPHDLAHVFEPFYTTKDRGKGTGLGLATVYGIVKQAGGEIQVYSEPGAGTTFKIYLPQAGLEDRPRAERPPRPLPATGPAGAVMVVEDNDAVRETTIMILRDQGYEVISADSGEQALQLFQQLPGPIQLLITDVVMTRMSGKELAAQLTALQPDLKVLYVSGYTDNVIAHHGVLDPGAHFLQKPFTGEALAAKIQELLTPDPGPQNPAA